MTNSSLERINSGGNKNNDISRTKEANKGSLHNNIGISRARVAGLQNSHSSKRLPTWKATTSEVGISSPVGVNNLSMDRASLGGGANQQSTGPLIMQSRAELLQNEYKKVIKNHHGTIATGPGVKYDDTHFLKKMFTKK